MGGSLGKQGGEGKQRDESPVLAKVVLVGAPGVGTTSFFHRFMDDYFYDQDLAKLGLDNRIRLMTLPEPEPSAGPLDENTPEEDAAPVWLAMFWRRRVDFGDGRTFKFDLLDVTLSTQNDISLFFDVRFGWCLGAAGLAVLFRADDAETWTKAVMFVDGAKRWAPEGTPVCLVCTACDLIPSAAELLGSPGEPANIHECDGKDEDDVPKEGKLHVDWNTVGQFMDEYNAGTGSHHRIPLVFASSKVDINVRIVPALLLGLKEGWDVPEEYFDTDIESRLSSGLTKSAVKR